MDDVVESSDSGPSRPARTHPSALPSLEVPSTVSASTSTSISPAASGTIVLHTAASLFPSGTTTMDLPIASDAPAQGSPASGMSSGFSAATQEILRRINSTAAQGTPGWEAARARVLESMLTSEQFESGLAGTANHVTWAGSSGRGSGSADIKVRGGRGGASTTMTPGANGSSGRGRGRGRPPGPRRAGRGGRKGRKRKRDDTEEDETAEVCAGSIPRNTFRDPPDIPSGEVIERNTLASDSCLSAAGKPLRLGLGLFCHLDSRADSIRSTHYQTDAFHRHPSELHEQSNEARPSGEWLRPDPRNPDGVGDRSQPCGIPRCRRVQRQHAAVQESCCLSDEQCHPQRHRQDGPAEPRGHLRKQRVYNLSAGDEPADEPHRLLRWVQRAVPQILPRAAHCCERAGDRGCRVVLCRLPGRRPQTRTVRQAQGARQDACDERGRTGGRGPARPPCRDRRQDS